MTHANEKHALRFATKAHEGQTRKYSEDPYIVHPMEVAEIVRSVQHTQEMIAAALLHDTVEDTNVTLQDIKEKFGSKVAMLVAWLSDISTPFHGNRAARKELDRQHLALAPPEAKTIKLADLIDNAASIKENDTNFWKVYRVEATKLIDVLGDGDAHLIRHLRSMIGETCP